MESEQQMWRAGWENGGDALGRLKEECISQKEGKRVAGKPLVRWMIRLRNTGRSAVGRGNECFSKEVHKDGELDTPMPRLCHPLKGSC